VDHRLAAGDDVVGVVVTDAVGYLLDRESGVCRLPRRVVRVTEPTPQVPIARAYERRRDAREFPHPAASEGE